MSAAIFDRPPHLIPDTIPLREFGFDMIRVACRRCELRCLYSTDAMIERVGADYPMTHLLLKIAVALGCETAAAQREGRLMAGEPRCGLYYVELAGGGRQG